MTQRQSPVQILEQAEKLLGRKEIKIALERILNERFHGFLGKITRRFDNAVVT